MINTFKKNLYQRLILFLSPAFRKMEERAWQVELKKDITRFKSCGVETKIGYPYRVLNHNYISIGNYFSALSNLRIEAIDTYNQQTFTPQISIGNNVVVNTDIHIGCINKVIIGDNVLMASRIYISDHSHGEVTEEALRLPPLKRSLVSKGPVVIKNNVWIGEGVCIMPGVTIGENAIIGANAVVTRDVPANAVVAGVPAQIIKSLQ